MRLPCTGENKSSISVIQPFLSGNYGLLSRVLFKANYVSNRVVISCFTYNKRMWLCLSAKPIERLT